MITNVELASWEAERPCVHADDSREQLVALLEICASAAAILAEFELFHPTHIELSHWFSVGAQHVSPLPIISVAVDQNEIVASVLRSLEGDPVTIPKRVRLHGRGTILEPRGVDFVLDDLVTIAGMQLAGHWISISTSCDAWMPHDLLGMPQPARYELNAPRLEGALTRITRELGLELSGDSTKYAFVNGFQVTNLTFDDGDVFVPPRASEATVGETCTLLLQHRQVVMGPVVLSGSGGVVRTGYLIRNPDARVLITYSLRHTESYEVLSERFALDVAGVAPLRWIGEDPPHGMDIGDVLIEDLPRGRALSELWPLPEEQVARIGAGCAETLARAHAAGFAVAGIFPQLIYAEDGEFTAMVPRGPMFIASVGKPVHGPGCYRVPYMGYETLILGRKYGIESDIAGLCMLLYHVTTGQHPYGKDIDDLGEMVERIATNDCTPYPGSPSLGKILMSGMVQEPERRPTAKQLAELLRAWRPS